MTVGTNALLERRGTRTALVTTEGFRDVLEIARQNRPSLYDLAQNRPPPLIPCELRFTVKERMGPEGEVEALDEASIKETVSAIKESKVEAVAVCLIGGGAGPLISIYLVGATGDSYWPVVAWMVLLCIIIPSSPCSWQRRRTRAASSQPSSRGGVGPPPSKVRRTKV
jgi:Hydantoinase/oxoprolinase N-terminal region